ncbi:c-type cytochrome [Halomonas sp. Bachu 37]|uniref:c-type cytochrome n=1 Tax=Halomonas kashgarensis TaxID=3084920 RepID=UPI003216897C
MTRKILVCLALLLPVVGCGSDEANSLPDDSTAGDPAKGKAAIADYGCGSCHAIPGVPGANGRTGPSLERIAKRTYLAGVLPNTPEDMARWLRAPETIDPLTAMPNMVVSAEDARDITAYLYTLK